MLIISSRADGTDAEGFARRDVFSVAEAGAAVVPLGGGAALRRVAGGRLLVLVHGFNNPFADVLDTYATVARRIGEQRPGLFDAVVGYAWPGGASQYAYFGAKARAAEAGRRLRRHLRALRAAGCTLDLAGHSMGVRVMLKALRAPAPFRIRRALALGAAVGPALLEDALATAGRFYVFHTVRDAMLGRWYRLFEWESPLGYAGLGPCAGIQGHPNVTLVNCDDVVAGHGGYRHSEPFVRYLLGELAAPQPAEQSVRLTPRGAVPLDPLPAPSEARPDRRAPALPSSLLVPC